MMAPPLLFLLIGQSNMAGRAPLDDQARAPAPGIRVAAADGQWRPAADPLHAEQFGFAGIGPGMSFGRALAEAMPGGEIGLIPGAVGATALSQWVKGGEWFATAVARTQAALAGGGRLTGILWHQGESDARIPAAAATYEARLLGMVGDLRESLDAGDVPFVAGELGGFLSATDFPGAAQINAALRCLAGRIPRYAWVSSSGLTDKGDRKHFDTASQRELGRRYAAAFLNLHAERTLG